MGAIVGYWLLVTSFGRIDLRPIYIGSLRSSQNLFHQEAVYWSINYIMIYLLLDTLSKTMLKGAVSIDIGSSCDCFDVYSA